MQDQENNVFRIGDVVTLKLNPEFRAVIQYFCSPKGNSFEVSFEKSIENDSLFMWANLSWLDSDNKILALQVPVIHLKHVEESNT